MIGLPLLYLFNPTAAVKVVKTCGDERQIVNVLRKPVVISLKLKKLLRCCSSAPDSDMTVTWYQTGAGLVLSAQVKPAQVRPSQTFLSDIMPFVTQHSIDEDWTGALTLINSSEPDGGLTQSLHSYLQRCLDTAVAALPNGAF